MSGASNVVTVRNLITGDTQEFVGITPIEAVIAAYAQSRGDWNTWNYSKYSDGVINNVKALTVRCGDFCAFKSPPATKAPVVSA